MKKLIILAMVLGLLMVSGCMASFPKTYSPNFSMNPKLGENKSITATATFETAFGKEATGESLKLQVLVDRKIEQWGFTKNKGGKHLSITVKNVATAGSLVGATFTGILCGATLYIIPAIATDNYRMTVKISEDGKEPIVREYNSSITTYTQIAFIFWGLFTYPIESARYKCIGDMLDHCMNDLMGQVGSTKEISPKEAQPKKEEAVGKREVDRQEEFIALDRHTARYYHRADCKEVRDIDPRASRKLSKEQAEARGLKPCPICKP